MKRIKIIGFFALIVLFGLAGVTCEKEGGGTIEVINDVGYGIIFAYSGTLKGVNDENNYTQIHDGKKLSWTFDEDGYVYTSWTGLETPEKYFLSGGEIKRYTVTADD